MSTKTESLENTYKAIIETIPNVDTNDIDLLIKDIFEIYTLKQDLANNIDDWIPSKTAVKEILRANVKVSDLKFCIDDFKKFSKTKGWNINDNLDAKLVAHIKIMASNERIILEINE